MENLSTSTLENLNSHTKRKEDELIQTAYFYPKGKEIQMN